MFSEPYVNVCIYKKNKVLKHLHNIQKFQSQMETFLEYFCSGYWRKIMLDN